MCGVLMVWSYFELNETKMRPVIVFWEEKQREGYEQYQVHSQLEELNNGKRTTSHFQQLSEILT